MWEMKCLGSLQLSAQKGFEDVTNRHEEARQQHQRGEANHSASVFFSRLPVCHANIFERHSLIAVKALGVRDNSIFICNQKCFMWAGSTFFLQLVDVRCPEKVRCWWSGINLPSCTSMSVGVGCFTPKYPKLDPCGQRNIAEDRKISYQHYRRGPIQL